MKLAKKILYTGVSVTPSTGKARGASPSRSPCELKFAKRVSQEFLDAYSREEFPGYREISCPLVHNDCCLNKLGYDICAWWRGIPEQTVMRQGSMVFCCQAKVSQPNGSEWNRRSAMSVFAGISRYRCSSPNPLILFHSNMQSA